MRYSPKPGAGMPAHAGRQAMNGRPTLHFTLRGLSEREGTLFKSFVRIIDHRTHHHWVWRDASADLLVLHDELRQTPADPSMATLHIGQQPRRPDPGCAHLAIPFRAEELEDCLNMLGGLLMQRRDRGIAGEHPSITAAPWLIRLRRWPPQHLLAGPQQVRLAALITGQPMTFTRLCEHSGLARETCASFVRRLSEAGLLHQPQSAPPAAPQAVPEPGILARIRSRLALVAGARK